MRPSKALLPLLLSVPLIGARPAPPPPSTNAPEIAFTNISGGERRHYQLRVANEDGTGAATLVDNRDVGQMVAHMGPRADGTILLVQGGKVSLVRYQSGSTGTKLLSIEALPSIGTAPGAQDVDFSPDGKNYVFFANNDTSLWIFNIETRSFYPLIQLASAPHAFAFTRDGSAVLYLDHVSDTDAILKRVALSGGPPAEVGIRGNYWDVEPAHRSNGYVLVRGVDIKSSRIEYHPADGSGPFDLAQGYAPSLRCDDGTVIYQKLNSGGSTVSLLRYDLPTGSGFTTSSSGNYWPDYVGC